MTAPASARSPEASDVAALVRLIAITDDLRDGPDGLLARCAAAVRGGATMVQVRFKESSPRELVGLTRALVAALPVPVLVNDRADVALAAGAAGVHVGVDDLPVAALRPVVPVGFLIGASYGAPDEAAHAAGADYVGIGPVAVTPSKRDAGAAIGVEGFRRLRAHQRCPAVAIGGIAPDAPQLLAALRAVGADGVAAIRSVLGAADPASAAWALRRAIGS